MGEKKTAETPEALYEKYKGNIPRLKRELKRLLKEAKANDDILLIGKVNYCFALISYRQGQRTSLLLYAIKASSMLDKTADRDMIARSKNLLGIAYVAQENHQLALDAYNAAFEALQKKKQTRLLKNTVLSNIAECYYQMGDYKKSVKITEKCLADFEKSEEKNYDTIAIVGANLSDGYESLEEYEKAEAVLGRMEPIVDRLTLKSSVCLIYARRACVAYKMGDTRRGNAYADKAYEAVALCTDTYELHRDFEKIAHAQISAGEYDRADQFANILLNYAKSTGHTLDKIIAYRVQADYFNTIQDTKNALGYYRRLNKLYELRLKEEKAMQLDMLKRVEATEKEVRQLMQRIKRSEEKAEREPLTGLLNRAALLKTANAFAESAKEKRTTIGGIFIDIDYFKEYNDTYGHARGDEIIQKVAAACRERESAGVRFARYGGDEFFAVVLGHSDQEVRRIAAGICAQLREADVRHEKNPCGHRATLSVGVVNIDMSDGGNTILDVVNYADKALYYAKNTGRNAIYAFDVEHYDESDRRDTYINVEF